MHGVEQEESVDHDKKLALLDEIMEVIRNEKRRFDREEN